MQLEKLFDKARKNNWPYFFMAIKNSFSNNILEKDNSMLNCWKKLSFHICIAKIHNIKIFLTTNQNILNNKENIYDYNKILSKSFSIAFGIPVIFGRGLSDIVAYRDKRSLNIGNSRLELIIEKIAGPANIDKHFTTKYYISSADNDLAYLNMIYRQVLDFKEDIIPAFIVGNSILHGQPLPWIESIKYKITNYHAKKYLEGLKRNKLVS